MRWMVLLACAALPAAGADDTAPPSRADYAWARGRLELVFPDRCVTITPLTRDAVEVVCQPRGEAPNPPGHALATHRKPARATLTETAEGLAIDAGGLTVEYLRTPPRLRFQRGGRLLVEEQLQAAGPAPAFRFRLAEDEQLFGGGARVLGRMNRRGERLTLYNSASYGYETNAPLMYYSMPAVVSSKKYLLAFDNGARGSLDLDADGDGLMKFQAVGGRRAYIVASADTWPGLAGQIADVTGRQPLLPRWALGHLASRMAYHTQAEVEAAVAAHRAAGVPLDAVVLDLFWFGSSIFGHMGNLEWDRSSFPQPLRMMADLRRQGVKTILITEPLVLTASSNWTSALRHDALATDSEGRPYTFTSFFGEAALIDVFKPEARDWFWTFYRRHTADGVAGWWGDLGEPETHPDDIRHATGRGADVHNLYGHAWASLVYEGFQRDFPRQRPFILMRSGFLGTQRYGILPWSGDVARSWGGLRAQVELALQMGLQGVAWMHSDLGGFAGGRRDPELYTRWLQYGAFQPIFRPHGHEEIPSEPIHWDDATLRRVRRYIQLRYAMLPYNYTLMFENATAGLPLMRPLFYADERMPADDSLRAYLWGDAFLVAPITEPDATRREIPLPEGVWFDWWSGLRHEGGRTITVPVTIEDIPVFVRAGAFVPMCPPMAHTEQYTPASLEIHFFADASVTASSGHVYDDDDVRPDAWARQRYELAHFTSARREDGTLALQIDGERHAYPGRPPQRVFEFVIHALDNPPSAVRVDGHAHPVSPAPSGTPADPASWASADRTLRVRIVWDGRPVAIEIPPPSTP